MGLGLWRLFRRDCDCGQILVDLRYLFTRRPDLRIDCESADECVRRLVGKLAPPRIDRYMVTVGAVENAMRWAVGLDKLVDGSVAVKYLDQSYWLPSEDQLGKLIEWARVKHKWSEDDYDCDDFAWRFKSRASWGLGINGVAFVSDPCTGHAYNIILAWTSDGAVKPYVYDPTMDRLQDWRGRDMKWYCLLAGSLIIV